jgi:DNA modification methylase
MKQEDNMAVLKFKSATKQDLETNVIYCADNLEVMKQMPSESIDLIYVDPPFFSGRKYETIWGDTVEVAYEDYTLGGVDTYINWLTERLEQMYRLLKPTGSLFVHLDYRAVHYIKVQLDKIFGQGQHSKGRKHLRNEILWCYSIGGKSSNQYARKHDTILWYSKNSKEWVFNSEFAKIPRKSGSHMKTVTKNGEVFQVKKDRKTGKVYEYPISKGKIAEDYWIDIEQLNREDKERVGWDTQKPLKLLDRIIQVHSHENNVIADFFCGCGTTIVSAHLNQRKYIGCDISSKATTIIRKRLSEVGEMPAEATINTLSKSQALRLNHADFEDYMVRSVGGTPNTKSIKKRGAKSDGGIDGFLIKDGTPIQVRQKSNVGRGEIDEFHKHLNRNGRGIFIAISFTKGSYAEAARLQREEGKNLQLLTVDDVIRESYQDVS